MTKVGCTPPAQHGLALALLPFLALMALSLIAHILGRHLFPSTFPASDKDLAAKALKCLRFVLAGFAVLAYTFATSLAVLATLSPCSSQEKHALALTTLLFLTATLISGSVTLLVGRFSRTHGRYTHNANAV
jgi:hypothetical protein